MPKITITDDHREADAVVCARRYPLQPLLLPDNLIGRCTECDHGIQFRPDAPNNIPKICHECAMENADTEEILIRPKTLEEVRDWLFGRKN